jgi:1-deoxy-D-xylulose-5-phosphate reductoisomerase
MKSCIILGSTGSIGQSTLEVIRAFPQSFSIQGIAAYSNIDLLLSQIQEFHPTYVAVADPQAAKKLQEKNPPVKVFSGLEGICEMVSLCKADLCVAAMSGSMGLKPCLQALKQGSDLALANKEILVASGALLMEAASKQGRKILPLDSEHSALFQCLEASPNQRFKKLILTASGGPFFKRKGDFDKITLEEALAHPTWKMGPKITVDSSTMMNKGLEVIEAFWLFKASSKQIEVVIHPQSLVHSFVEFEDGALLAQVSKPSMLLPIQYALFYPQRTKQLIDPLDFSSYSAWEFYPPNFKDFPCLQLAYAALEAGGSMPCFLNAANEVLVERFLKKQIRWVDIAIKLEALMLQHCVIEKITLDDLEVVDKIAREKALLI